MADHTELTSNFWEGIQTGTFRPWTRAEIEHFVQSTHLGSEPLTPLSESDRTILAKDMVALQTRYLNRSIYSQLATDEVYLLPKGTHIPQISDYPPSSDTLYCPPKRNSNELVLKHASAIVALAEAGISALTRQEKKAFLSTTQNWHTTRYAEPHIQGALLGYGMRSLEDCGYTDEDFLRIVQTVKRDTGKERIAMLDIGGANGLALQDVKRLDPTITTYNLTPTVDPSMHPVDHLLIEPAEHMSAALRGKIDLAISNMAFQYCTYPDLALENTLQALSIGGRACLSVQSPGRHGSIPNFTDRMASQYRRLAALHHSRAIELTVHPCYTVSPLDFTKALSAQSCYAQSQSYPSAFLTIAKRRHIPAIRT